LSLHREVDLPDDAFTDDVSAKVDQHKLTITIARRDPEGPAMQVSVAFQ
jgi:HSP20 family molecular chaperone IbpA